MVEMERDLTATRSSRNEQVMERIIVATSIEEIADCFPVMQELRQHLDRQSFIDRIRRQQQEYNYQLVYLQINGETPAVAGFRISESLAWGRFLYIDDLVTSADCRSHGYGTKLFAWLVDYARSRDCQQLTLDSGVQRFAAHRFYLTQRMNITSHHFTLEL
jgi:GNAT superfamily N-acetyltransferase